MIHEVDCSPDIAFGLHQLAFEYLEGYLTLGFPYVHVQAFSKEIRGETVFYLWVVQRDPREQGLFTKNVVYEAFIPQILAAKVLRKVAVPFADRNQIHHEFLVLIRRQVNQKLRYSVDQFAEIVVIAYKDEL